MKKHIISVMLIAGTVALCGCSANNGTSSDIQSSSQSESQQTAEAATSEVETAEAPAESSVLADLTGTYDDVSEKFEFSDGWSNGSDVQLHLAQEQRQYFRRLNEAHY